jgi:hypothetical protein
MYMRYETTAFAMRTVRGKLSMVATVPPLCWAMNVTILESIASPIRGIFSQSKGRINAH